jgi:SAM-dependent methyltransferase
MTAPSIDIGRETLDRVDASLSRYNEWLFEQLEHVLQGRVLETGSGIGTFSARLLTRASVVLTDVADAYVEELQGKYGSLPHVRVIRWDLNDPAPAEIERSSVDSILCSNVLEHIRNDEAALQEMHGLLAPGGRLALLVPAHQILYNSFDRGLDHYRRYSRRSLGELLVRNGLEVEDCWYFNALGALGWYLNGNVLRRRLLPSNQMKVFDALVPLLRAERYISTPFGVSLIAIARRRT